MDSLNNATEEPGLVVTTYRVDRELVRQVTLKANIQGMSRSELTRRLLQKYLDGQIDLGGLNFGQPRKRFKA